MILLSMDNKIRVLMGFVVCGQQKLMSQINQFKNIFDLNGQIHTIHNRL